MMRATTFAAVVGLALTSGCAARVPCRVDAPADAPAQSVYVAVCGDDQNDGTNERPFRTIPRALASGSGFIALGEGEFDAATSPIDRTLTIRGAGATLSVIRGAATGGGPVPKAVIESTGRGTVSLRDVGVTGLARSGVLVSGGALALTRVTVWSIEDTSSEPLAHGVVGVDAAIVAEGVNIRSNAGWGVVAKRSTFDARASLIERNARGGIAGIGSTTVTGTIRIDGGGVSENGEVGVAAFGASLRVSGTTIARTTTRGSAGGDGVLAVSLIGEGGAEVTSQVDLSDVRITGNARAGVLLDGRASGTLTRGLVGENGRAGLWVQGGRAAVAFTVSGVTFDGNIGSGVVVTSGASLSFASSTVTGTRALSVIEGLGSVSIGDGFSVFDGASAAVTGSTFGPSARVAVLADGASSSTTFAGNRVTMAGDAVVLQGGSGVTFDVSTNALSSGSRIVDAGAGRALATARGVVAVTRAP